MTALITNQTFDVLIQHLQQMGNAIRVTPTEDPLYQEFIARFPANQLTKLSLEQYCIGKADSQSFCWWLERGLEPVLGRYMPGTARGHILYFQADGVVYKHSNLKDLSDQDALEYTLAVQAAIANVTEDEDWHWIDSRSKIFEHAGVSPRVTLGFGRILRLLAVYHPDTALPISSTKHIGHFLEKLGCPKLSIPVEKKAVARMYLLRDYYQLAKQQLPELNPLGFVRALYSPELKLAPTKEEFDETDIVDEEPSVMEQNILETPMNQILFGPPGTGKTYETIRAALAILDPDAVTAYNTAIKNSKTIEQKQAARETLRTRFTDLQNEQRIRFVTFHQSFSYEDFVEGIRAEADDEGKLNYRIDSGVFKQICDDAHAVSSQNLGISENPAIWKISINGAGDSPTKRFCLDRGEARIGWGDTGDLRHQPKDNPYYKALSDSNKGTLKNFAEEMSIGDILLCLHSAEQIGAVGVVTSDYRYEPELDASLGINSDYQHVRSVKWLYRDLTLSVLPLNGGMRFTQKSVYAVHRFNWSELWSYLERHQTRQAGNAIMPTSESKPYVLIIDEINRGNISRIFGELITLLEPSKREGAEEAITVTLPYSKKPFTVPNNVFVIGTMNTADRSLAGLDLALRRRFTFIEMPPRPELLDDVNVEGLNIGALLRVMNQRISFLLDRDHCIGHAYFMPLIENNHLAQLSEIFKQKIIPLLQEYFFEDWQRIRWVLNDQNKDDTAAFVIEDQSLSVDTLFRGVDSGLPNRKVWQLNEAAFDNIAAYQGIL